MFKESHQFITGISFGLTSGVITALGLIVGLNLATASKLAIVSGIIVVAIADGLADAAGLHLSEEAEVEEGRNKHTPSEIWMTTICTFLSISITILTFVIPVLLFPLKNAIILDVIWGILLIILLNYYIANITKKSPFKLISEHVILVLIVIQISHKIGDFIALWLK
jgi:VIT1/CCC1 family predicted Fe2+/Mn2+ transporter